MTPLRNIMAAGATRAAIFCAALGTSFLAYTANAQPIIDYDAMPEPMQTALIDLDDDGLPEVASAYALNDRFDIVTIRPPQAGGDRDFDTAFVVPINLTDSPSVEALPNGNLRITWGCFACGRYHSNTSVVVDARNGTLQVIGYDDSYADRIFAAVITCSVNLLTGDAIIKAVAVDRQDLTTDARSFDLSALQDAPRPQVCQTGYARYTDEFLQENYGDQ